MTIDNQELLDTEQTIKVMKALNNPVRWKIIQWLNVPSKHFDLEGHLVDADIEGVCVSFITKKSGLSQSTISNYLMILQSAGLIQSNRIGSWTYYRRSESNIQNFVSSIQDALIK